MFKYSIGENYLLLNNNTIKLEEPIQDVKSIGNVIIVLYYRGNRQINFEPLNNNQAFNIDTGKKEWEIEELSRNYEKTYQKKVHNEFFSNIKFENKLLIAYGYYFIFQIDIEGREIVKILPLVYFRKLKNNHGILCLYEFNLLFEKGR